MKNILILEDSSLVNFGGGQNITLTVMELLSSENKCILTDFAKSSRFIKEAKILFPDIQYLPLKSFRNNIRYVVISKTIMFFSFITGFIYNLIYILRKLNFEEIKFIYATTRITLVYAYVIHTFTGIPYIYHCHLVNKPIPFLNNIWMCILNNADCILCVSKIVKESINTNNSILLYNPNKNLRGFKGEKNGEKFVVASIGSLIPIKGTNYFIEAAKFNPNIEHRVYGIGIDYHSLKLIAGNNLRFMGFIPNIIDEFYKDIDILVVSTIIEEALSLVIVEAKSAGIPVITTNIGGQSEIVMDNINGFKVPIKDSNAIAEKVYLLTSDINKYNYMSKQSYLSVNIFDYNNFKNIILSTFSG